MREIQTFFLRAKHWQLFLLLLILAVVDSVARYVLHLPKGYDYVIGAVEYVVLLVWFWSMGTFLAGLSQARFHLSKRMFHIALIFTPVESSFSFWYGATTNGVPFSVAFVLQAFGVFCFWYLFYFLARSLVMAEMEAIPIFEQYVGTLFALLFFVIGIWFIQPRVNRLYENAREYSQAAFSQRSMTT